MINLISDKEIDEAIDKYFELYDSEFYMFEMFFRRELTRDQLLYLISNTTISFILKHEKRVPKRLLLYNNNYNLTESNYKHFIIKVITNRFYIQTINNYRIQRSSLAKLKESLSY